MASSPDKPLPDPHDGGSSHNQLAEEIDEHLRSVKNPTERRTIARLLRDISTLPLEHTRAGLETSAQSRAAKTGARSSK